MEEMFCFQCQQTAHNSGCEGRAGVCGKKSDTANYQDELTGALIGLSRAVRKKLALNPDASFEHADELILKGLFTTITNVNFFNDTIIELIHEVNVEKDRIYPDIMNYDVRHIWEDQEDIRSLKSLILFGLRGMAAYAYHAYALDYVDRNILDFFYEGLEAIASEKSSDELLALVLKTGEINFRCMELLDHANSGTYGNPVPTEVPLTIEKGPFIVVSGHDLHDMELLLKQTEGKGINIYTHSEMLPAHGYPELKKYSHLKGNFGTAWQSQQSEFHNIPAPILFTTNCLMPVRQSYCDRVFTTSIVSYPDLVHIGEDKDFTPVIEKALECKGYPEDHPMTGINGGSTVTTGFAHNAHHFAPIQRKADAVHCLGHTAGGIKIGLESADSQQCFAHRNLLSLHSAPSSPRKLRECAAAEPDPEGYPPPSSPGRRPPRQWPGGLPGCR